ncbi:MAG: V-type ATP synthase subunit D [Victivallaceae bacterium]|nr:V-type ATP synthase subunit D [Victivallaceae bacterium]
MAKIKLSKSELKTQQDALKQFMRFLPTLQLKKQQLQMEIRRSTERMEENESEYRQALAELQSWVALFGDDVAAARLIEIVSLTGITSESWNIAGVEVPVFKEATFDVKSYDLYLEDAWFSDAVNKIQELIILRESGKLLKEQNHLLSRELTTTSQRVNLFEKIKIPECRENIRRIRIYLSDMDTSGVVRSKIAKKKTQERSAA